MNTLLSKFFLAEIFLLCYTLFVFAQCPDDAELNLTATLYTQENGLASNMLTGVTKDSVGYRYFLAVDGRYIRYDGVNFSTKTYDRSSFIHYNLSDPLNNCTWEYINDILYKYEKNGKYKWSIAGDSLVCIDLSKNKRESFLLPEVISAYNNPGFFPYGDLCFVTTPDKVFRLQLQSKKFLEMALPPGAISEAFSLEHLSVITRSEGSCYLLLHTMVLKLNSDSTIFKPFSTFSPKAISTVFQEMISDRYLFVAGLYAEIYVVDLVTGDTEKISLADFTGIKNSSVLRIMALENYHNYLLIGTSNNGLFIFNYCTMSMQHFQYGTQTSTTALSNSVVWLDVDDENMIWMQTDAGLIKIEVNEQLIRSYLPSSLKSDGVCNDCNNVRAMYESDKDNLLIGSLAGVFNFNLSSERFSNILSPDGKPVWSDHAISAITGDGNGNIFIAGWTEGGVLLLNNGKKKLVNILQRNDHSEFSYINLRCLLYDSHHVLWIGTNEGFLRITNLDEFEKNDYTGQLDVSNRFPGDRNKSMSVGFCFAMAEDSMENIWLGTMDGLYVYDYKTDSIKKFTHVPGNTKSISDNEVRSFCFSKDGSVWIGTNTGGLNHFERSTETFSAITTEDGLPNNSIYTILEDNNGFLWLGTNAGLCRFNKADHSFRNYTTRDGIQNSEFNTNAVFALKDGRFCFGGRTGFNIFHPDSMNTTISPSQVVITRFKIFDKEFPVTDSVYHLSHNQNSFTFDFAALNYYRSNDNQYAYMMESADKNWINSGNRQFTSYNNLPPGHYRFMVRAANYTGAWSEGAITMSFIIAPAWYNTWWFRIAIALLIAAGVYSLYRYRLRQVMKLQSVRNRIASDLHDEIGSTLSSISISSTIIQKKLNGDDREVKTLLNQISNNTDNMMEAMSDIVWTINTKNDRFDNVINRMRAFAIEILEPKDCTVHFNADKNLNNIHLDMAQRKNLYLIFKEAINNAAKYSECKNVWIDISLEGKKLAMKIRDDGKGFQVPAIIGEESLSGNGIRNMKKRAEELGGEMMIDSVSGEGTMLSLRFTI